MAKKFDRKLVLASGEEFYGYGFGDKREVINELVFCTSMVGYQELVSDPSCAGLLVCMTYPVIGNYGVTDEDFESKAPSLGGLIVRDYNDLPSNFRYTKTLAELMEEHGIVGISGVDTRKITRILREKGSCKALICSAYTPTKEALWKLSDFTTPRDQVFRVSCRKKWYARTPNFRYNVVAVDCGIKLGIVRALNAAGCNVTVVPYDTTQEEIIALKPDGLLISNGPGDPADVPSVVELIRELRGKVPMFGISLGHLLICMAYGGETYKMKVGHHGGNHPVRVRKTGRIVITSQGHAHAVRAESLEGSGLTVTCENVLDGTVEGVESKADRVMAVQFNPESAPGPQDSVYLFDEFIDMMKEDAHNA